MNLQPEYTIYDRNQACVVCNAPRRPDERLIYLGVNIDFEGNLVLCETCVDEINACLGKMVTVSVEKMKARERNLVAENESLRAKLDAGKRAFA